MRLGENKEGMRSIPNDRVRENFFGHLDKQKPLAELVEDLEKVGFNLVRKEWSVKEHGIRFLDPELDAKDDNEIVDRDTQKYNNFLKRVRNDYSLFCYVWKKFSPFKLTEMVNSIFENSITTEKKDRHQ